MDLLPLNDMRSFPLFLIYFFSFLSDFNYEFYKCCSSVTAFTLSSSAFSYISFVFLSIQYLPKRATLPYRGGGRGMRKGERRKGEGGGWGKEKGEGRVRRPRGRQNYLSKPMIWKKLDKCYRQWFLSQFVGDGGNAEARRWLYWVSVSYSLSIYLWIYLSLYFTFLFHYFFFTFTSPHTMSVSLSLSL